MTPTQTRLRNFLTGFKHNIDFKFHLVLCPFLILFFPFLEGVDHCGSLGSLRRINYAYIGDMSYFG